MHSYCSNNAVTALNTAKKFDLQKFEIYLCFVCQPPSMLYDPVPLVPRLWNFYTTKVIVLDLRNCCSEECLSTAHGASFYPLLDSFYLQITHTV